MLPTVNRAVMITVVLTVLSLPYAVCAQNHPPKWKFMFFADSIKVDPELYINTNILAELATATVREKPAFLVFGGDMAWWPSVDVFRLWTNIMAPVYQAQIPIFPITGNHDAKDRATFNSFFGQILPTNLLADMCDQTYAITHSNALILAFDTLSCTNDYRVNQQWLEAVLSTNVLPHVFAFGHVPAFKVAHQDCLDDYPEHRDAFWRTLSNARCRFYFCGHDHFYDHTRLDDHDANPDNDLHQVIVGTAGAPFYLNDIYDGLNDYWTPVRLYHAVEYGYVTVEIDATCVTSTWHQRTGTNVYESAESFSLSLLPSPVLSLDFSPNNASLTLSWSGPAILQSSPQPTGPFEDLTEVQSPFAITNLAKPAFYRLKSPCPLP